MSIKKAILFSESNFVEKCSSHFLSGVYKSGHYILRIQLRKKVRNLNTQLFHFFQCYPLNFYGTLFHLCLKWQCSNNLGLFLCREYIQCCFSVRKGLSLALWNARESSCMSPHLLYLLVLAVLCVQKQVEEQHILIFL